MEGRKGKGKQHCSSRDLRDSDSPESLPSRKDTEKKCSGSHLSLCVLIHQAMYAGTPSPLDQDRVEQGSFGDERKTAHWEEPTTGFYGK